MHNYKSKFKTDLTDRCIKLSLKVIALVDTLPYKQSAKVIGLQLLRSITSIGANLVEARASSSRLEFKKFHEISLKSANEAKYWLMLLKESRLAEAKIINEMLDEVIQIANMIASGVLKLKSKNL